ncbi:MAG: NUDIX domain-containing protein [Candidatus Magasanikbacteria bacterium]|nr:NUDIX domain-containing protein [Candidatus Magasanikbacteria bacterium]
MDVRVRCVTIQNEKLLLIHRVRPDLSDDFYFFPGGGVEEGELPEAACVREMYEEVSVTVEPVKLLGIQFHTDRLGDHCQMYYLVDIKEGEIGKGTGDEYTEALLSTHGTHDPELLSFEEFRDGSIKPGKISEQLVPHLDNLMQMPFFMLDERNI